MIRVFIDESGNLGRGGEYFVLAAAVFDTEKGATRGKRIIKREQQLLSKERELDSIAEIKSSSLKFEQRQRILSKIIKKADVDIFYLAAYKPNVALLSQGKSKNLVYNYLAKLLTDMIFSKYNDDFVITFDQRSTCVESMNSLPDYIEINAYTRHNHFDKNILVRQRDSKTTYNLQTADVIAGTVYQAYKKNSKHFLNLLAPRIIKADEFPRTKFKNSLF